MNTLTVLMIITSSILLMKVLTTPKGVLVGFKLPAALFVGTVGVAFVLFTNDVFMAHFGVTLIHERVLNTQAGWLTAGWMLILIPSSKETRAKLDALRKNE
jgi:hypothetical protein